MRADSDARLREELLRRLAREPAIESARIGVFLRDGAVTLTGRVASDEQRMAAVDTVRRVTGVRAVADELVAEHAESRPRHEAEIAEAVAVALRSSPVVPESIYAEVRGRSVTLRGAVRWAYERREAERAVAAIPGVFDVVDEIAVEPILIESVLYDEDDHPTDDPSRAVRGEVLERDVDGSIVGFFDGLSWVVDPKAIAGDLGELATRPRSAGARRRGRGRKNP